MFLDDCGSRARLVEGLTERIAIYADSGWWVYPFSASVGSVKDGAPVDIAVLPIARSLKVHKARAVAKCCRLCVSDLDSYDLIVALDASIREQMLAVLKAGLSPKTYAYYESRIRLLSDFMGYTGAVEALDPDLQEAVKPYMNLMQMVDVSRADIDRKSTAYNAMIASFILGTAGLVKFIRDSFEEHLANPDPNHRGGWLDEV